MYHVATYNDIKEQAVKIMKNIRKRKNLAI